MTKFVGTTVTDQVYSELETLMSEKKRWLSTADLLRDVVKEGLEKLKGA